MTNFLPTDVNQLAELLRKAEQAHHVYEQLLGHADADWPTFYAAHMLGEPVASYVHFPTVSAWPRADQSLVDAIVQEKQQWMPVNTNPLHIEGYN